KQNGILIGNELKRYGISPRLDANITKRLSAGASVNYNYSKNKNSAINSLSSGAFFRPDVGVYNQDNSYTTIPAQGGALGPNIKYRNPLGGSAKVSNQADMSTIYGSAYAEYDILDNLNLKSKLSFYLSNEHVSNFAPSF